MKGLLLFFILIGFGTSVINDYFNDGWSVYANAKSSQRKQFYVALEPNRDGVKYIEKYLLEMSSNPESRLYGRYHTQDQIDLYIRPYHTQQTINDLLDIDIICIEHTSAVLWCTSDEGTIHYHFRDGVPKSFRHRINFIEMEKEGNSFMTLMSKHRSDWFHDDGEKPEVDPSVSETYITREVTMRTYMNGQSGNVNGSRTSVGAIEFLDQEGFSQSDMIMVQNHSCTVNNPVKQHHIIGWNDPMADDESELDMAVIWQAAAGAELWYEDYEGWIFGWAANMYRRTDKTQVVSLSWGWNEDAQCGTIVKYCNDSRVYIERTNIELMKLAATGVTILVSSGDAGSPGRTNEDCSSDRPPLNAVFPGSSPWILSVGATYLKKSENTDEPYDCPICDYLTCGNVTRNGYQEGVTTWRMTGWTSGSGFSNFTSTPVWQSSEVNKYLSSNVELPDQRYFNRSGRAYPDISAYGHNCAMYAGRFKWQGGDGTSCSAPLLAGIIAYLNDYQQSLGRPVLGYVNPLIYKMRKESPNTFNDISEGDSACTEVTCCPNRNFGFLPMKGGWDPLSGVGTPRVSEMKKYLDTLTRIKNDEL